MTSHGICLLQMLSAQLHFQKTTRALDGPCPCREHHWNTIVRHSTIRRTLALRCTTSDCSNLDCIFNHEMHWNTSRYIEIHLILISHSIAIQRRPYDLSNRLRGELLSPPGRHHFPSDGRSGQPAGWAFPKLSMTPWPFQAVASRPKDWDSRKPDLI